MIKRFKIVECSNNDLIGHFINLNTKIKTENITEFFEKPLKTTMFDGLNVIVVSDDFHLKGRLK